MDHLCDLPWNGEYLFLALAILVPTITLLCWGHAWFSGTEFGALLESSRAACLSFLSECIDTVRNYSRVACVIVLVLALAIAAVGSVS